MWVAQTNTAASAAAAALPRACISAGLIGRLVERGLLGFMQFLARAGCVVVIARVGADTRCSARRWARVCRDSMSWAASVLERAGWQ
jgi:hypothetical protein